MVRILEDKGVVLPTDQERAVAAAQIGDWDTLLEDEYWRYFVSSIYALGIITGVDQSGAFHGTDYITRASAAVLYTKMADKVQRSGNDPKAFGITFEGDWSAASKEYREALEEEFYTVYPRLWARFGTANTARHISLFLVPREEIDGNDGITYTGFDDTKYETTASIKIANVYLDDWRHTAAIFAHELTHAATGVTLREIKSERLKSGNGVMENFRVGQAAFQRGLESLQHSITPLPDYSHLKITTGSLSAWLIMGSSATRPGRTRGICGSRNLIISRKTKPCALGSMRRTRIRTGFSPT